jgi:hypothetical protein
MAKLDAYKAKPTPLMFEHEEGQALAKALLSFDSQSSNDSSTARQM